MQACSSSQAFIQLAKLHQAAMRLPALWFCPTLQECGSTLLALDWKKGQSPLAGGDTQHTGASGFGCSNQRSAV